MADAETPSSAGVGVADALAAVTPLVDDSMQIPAPQASSVQVVVRVRPMIEREAGLKSSSVMDVTSPQNVSWLRIRVVSTCTHDSVEAATPEHLPGAWEAGFAPRSRRGSSCADLAWTFLYRTTKSQE